MGPNVSALIDELGDPRFVLRRRAEKQLRRLGFVAFDELLEAAESHSDLDVQARAKYLLQQVDIPWVREGDPQEVKSKLRNYDQLDFESRMDAVDKLLDLPQGGKRAAERVVRYEVDMMLAMGVLKTSDNELLARLISLLLQQQDWERIEKFATRFAKEFEASPSVLYSLAEAVRAQGRDQRAEAIALRAREAGRQSAAARVIIADKLRERGLAKWAEAEFRKAIAIGSLSSREVLYAVYFLSEMLHDGGKELEAARLLQQLVDAWQKDERVRAEAEEFFGRDLASFKSRMEYFYAEHQLLQQNPEKQREHLLTAIGHDPTDADVLIAMYRFKNADAAFREKTRRLIKQAAKKFEKLIAENPEKATNYNQYAWLISNTEGPYDRALEYSLKSLQLQPDTAAYLDTLGRCYYAAGDLDSAIEHQRRAVEKEPHSRIIARQLEFFLAEQEKTGRKKAEPEKVGDQQAPPQKAAQ